MSVFWDYFVINTTIISSKGIENRVALGSIYPARLGHGLADMADGGEG